MVPAVGVRCPAGPRQAALDQQRHSGHAVAGDETIWGQRRLAPIRADPIGTYLRELPWADLAGHAGAVSIDRVRGP